MTLTSKRRLGRRRLRLLAAAGWAGFAGASFGYDTYLEAPRTFTTAPGLFATLLDSGHGQMLRIGLLGDSQETSPGGAGAYYIPHLNRRLWDHYGNCGETMVVSNAWAGSGTPPAEWLWRAQSGPVLPAATGLDPEQIPPGIVVRAHHALSAEGQPFPWIAMLLPDGVLTADAALGGPPYFDTSGEIRAELFAATQRVSGEIQWSAIPRADPVPSFYDVPSGAGTTELGLSQPTFEIRSGLTPPLDFAGKPYLEVLFWGTDLAASTEIVGTRFVNTTAHTGAVMQPFAQTGYWTRSFVAYNGSSGPMLKAFGLHAAMIHTGANDGSHSVTAAEYHDDLVELVAWLRESMGDPLFPVIVACDVDFINLTPAQRIEFNQYPGVATEVAAGDPAMLVLNLRRIMLEDYGWGDGNYSYLADIVHLKPSGQKKLAASCVQALFDAVTPTCAADLDDSGAVDGADLGILLSQWGSSRAGTADLDASGAVDGSDLGLLLAAWGPCPSSPR